MALVFSSTGGQRGEHDLRPEGLRHRLVEERLPVPGGQDRRLHLHAVLGEALHDGDVGVGDQRKVDGVGAGVLDAEHLRADVGAAEVDGGVRVDGLEAGTAGTANFWKFSAAAVDDGEMP